MADLGTADTNEPETLLKTPVNDKNDLTATADTNEPETLPKAPINNKYDLIATADTNEPETLLKAPVNDKNDLTATAATSQSNEDKDKSDTLKNENGAVTRAVPNGEIGEKELKKEYGNDTRRNFHQRRSNKSKFDPSVLGVSNDAKKIRDLVAFYFSDSNLSSDQHLRDLVNGTTNHPVKIKHIHTFKRLKQYQPYSAVVAALRESDLFHITGSEGFEEIKRKIPYNPVKNEEAAARSVYIKGFGEETATTQFEVEAFFAQFGPTNSVRLRRDQDQEFKGSCFVEFQDKETSQKFLDLDPKPQWQGKHELKIMSKLAYLKEKNIMIDNGQVDPNSARPYRGGWKGGQGNGFRGDRGKRDGGDRSKHDGGDRDPDNWKKRRENDQKSGFRDNKHGRDNRSRNSHGRGRGNDRHGRKNDRNQERRDRDRSGSKAGTDAKVETDTKMETPAKVETDAKAETDAKVEASAKLEAPAKVETDAKLGTGNKAETGDKPEEPKKSKKREREDDAETEGPPAKKVVSKEEISNAS